MGGGMGMLVIALIVWLLGGNPLAVLQNAPPPQQQQPAERSEEENELAQFVDVVLADTEDVWSALFQQQFGRDYREPTLVLFTQQVRSGCGLADAGMGPFYCPADEKVYLDLSFFDELKRRFGAPGDFAMAYVVAHEVGHHVQNLLGVSDQVHQQRGRLSEVEANEQSVRLELQADFLAGVWAHHAQETKQILEEDDIEEALNAASAIGDDAIQKQARGYVNPDLFTHGTSQQRAYWFRRGFETGDLSIMNELFDRPYDEL
jgi:predicted metalloprotease